MSQVPASPDSPPETRSTVPGPPRRPPTVGIVAGVGVAVMLLIFAASRNDSSGSGSSGSNSPGSTAAGRGKPVEPSGSSTPAPATTPSATRPAPAAGRDGARAGGGAGSGSGAKADPAPEIGSSGGTRSPQLGGENANPDAPKSLDLPPDHPPISADDPAQVSVQWLGHSCFYLHSPGGIAVVTDPFDAGTMGLAAPGTGSHLITVSTPTPAHNATGAVRAFQGDTRQVLYGTGSVRGDVRVDPISLGTDGESRARYGYIIQMGPLRLAHLGGLTGPLTPAQEKAIGAVDLLLIPAGGEGIRPRDAAAVAVRLKPRMVVPMAYRPPAVDAGGSGMVGRLRPLEDFMSGTPFAVTAKETDIMLLAPRDLPPSTEILTLRYGH